MHLIHLKYENYGRRVEKGRRRRRRRRRGRRGRLKCWGKNVVGVNIFITKKLIEISAAKPGYLSGKECWGWGKWLGNKDVKKESGRFRVGSRGRSLAVTR
jgi:hypothetical protein